MARLLVLVEGQTEENFVNQVLSGHLCTKGFHSVSARLLGNARQKSRRGGIKAWSAVKSDIITHLRQDQEIHVTLMVDFYALPPSGNRAWPGRNSDPGISVTDKAKLVRDAVNDEVCQAMGQAFNPRRFVPFIVMHEFEGLLFSNCVALAEALSKPGSSETLLAIREEFATPEEINDNPNTAPSKRIAQIVPGYQKPLIGLRAVSRIGIETIRKECPEFARWLSTLESLGS